MDLNPDSMRKNGEKDGSLDFFYQMPTVCKLWYDIMAMSPKYWTKVTIFVDEDPTPLSDLEACLRNSRKLPITVRVGRRDSLKLDGEEGRRTRGVMDILRPHIHRGTEIVFQVIHGSSLPTVSVDLQDISSALTELHLECEHDDGAPSIEAVMHGEPRIINKLNLNAITLHGHMILDVLKNDDDLDIFGRDCTDLQFGNFDASNYDEEDVSILPAFFSALSSQRGETFAGVSKMNFPYKAVVIVAHPEKWLLPSTISATIAYASSWKILISPKSETLRLETVLLKIYALLEQMHSVYGVSQATSNMSCQNG